MAPALLAHNQEAVGASSSDPSSGSEATASLLGPNIVAVVAKSLGPSPCQETQTTSFYSPQLVYTASVLSVATWIFKSLTKPLTRTKLLSGNIWLVLTVLLIVSGVSCRRSGEYGAKPPADYDQDYNEGDDYEKDVLMESEEGEIMQISPNIKYQSMTDKRSMPPDNQFYVEKLEPIRPKRQKMGRTKLRPPTTKPANFKVSPQTLMSKYLHDSAEPLDDLQSSGKSIKRIERWEMKKLIPKPPINDADYDYTAEKLQGIVKSPEEFYDIHKDDYADDYDRRAYDSRIDHLKFILDPRLKKRPSTTDRVLSKLKPPTRSTSMFELFESQPSRTPAHHEDPDLTTLEVIPIFTVSTSTTETTKTWTVPTRTIPVYIKTSTEPPEPNTTTSTHTFEVLDAQKVFPLGSNNKMTRPPVYLMKQTEVVPSMPTMMVGDKGPVAYMVADNINRGSDVEDARYKIRNYLLRQGVDPDTNPEELICEYVEMESSASACWLTRACMLCSIVVALQAFQLY